MSEQLKSLLALDHLLDPERNMLSDIWEETYTDDDTTVRVHCEGTACWVDVERRLHRPSPTLDIELQFLLQPRNASGLPVGVPLLLHSEPYTLTVDPEQTGRAWSWLPARLTPSLLQRCHLRPRPVTIKHSTKSNSTEDTGTET